MMQFGRLERERQVIRVPSKLKARMHNSCVFCRLKGFGWLIKTRLRQQTTNGCVFHGALVAAATCRKTHLMINTN